MKIDIQRKLHSIFFFFDF